MNARYALFQPSKFSPICQNSKQKARMLWFTIIIHAKISATLIDDAPLRFKDWAQLHHKLYASALEVSRARRIFEENDAFIRNFSHTNVELTHNAFSDISWDAFRKVRLRTWIRTADPLKTPESFSNVMYAMRDGIDWEASGAVTPVRDQHECGSCWAFSATGAIEGDLYVNTGKLTVLSPQTFVDCDLKDQGCNGGTMEDAFDYVRAHGMCTDASNPYTIGRKGNCSCPRVVFVDDFARVAPSQHDLTAALVKTPISVSIEADQRVFQFYKSGVLEAQHCGKELNHGVLLTGYGFDYANGLGYWRVKNSWGKGWGEGGYVRLARDENTCGILNDASYPKGAHF